MPPPKSRAPQKVGAPGNEERPPRSAGNPPTSHKVIDNPGITEQFANQLIDILVVNGHTVSITLGAKRNTRDSLHGERETAIAINTRLTVDMRTAEALRDTLDRVLLAERRTPGGIN
jgi:hypothetical protein